MKTNTTNKSIHSRFYALLAKMPGATKEVVVKQYIESGSLTELYMNRPKDYERMLCDMQNLTNDRTPYVAQQDNVIPASQEVKKLRSAILHRLQKFGIDTTDWGRVNGFLELPRIAGKRLYMMNEEEMRAFIRKMESILVKEQAIREEEMRIARCN